MLLSSHLENWVHLCPVSKTIFHLPKKPGVYAIPCECGAQYIGETKRSIETRLKEHKTCVDKCDWEKNAIALHHKETKHKINWEDTKVVTQSSNKFVLRFKEAVAINSCKNMNQDKGLEIPKIWLETLSKKEALKSWKNITNPDATGKRLLKLPPARKQIITAQLQPANQNEGIRRSDRIKAQKKWWEVISPETVVHGDNWIDCSTFI